MKTNKILVVRLCFNTTDEMDSMQKNGTED